jgi:4-diphosphocytidyl-2-C-methyl-D-erythritol kinase
MLVFPNAKINLGLNITSRLNNGYHTLESVFYPVPWCDILEVVENRNFTTGNNRLTLHCTGLAIEGGMQTNLCVKAYELLSKEFDLPPIAVFLHKQIPSGAGLGGGSSDGACMLKLLNAMFNLKLTPDALKTYALSLGADCAFFMLNTPAYVTGIGEVLQPIDVSLKGNYIAIIKPPFSISTAYAYSKVIPASAQPSIAEIMNQPVHAWKHKLKNDFEQFLFPEYPLLQKIKEELYRQGAVYAGMSGSGSALFGLFTHPPQLLMQVDCTRFIHAL